MVQSGYGVRWPAPRRLWVGGCRYPYACLPSATDQGVWTKARRQHGPDHLLLLGRVTTTTSLTQRAWKMCDPPCINHILRRVYVAVRSCSEVRDAEPKIDDATGRFPRNALGCCGMLWDALGCFGMLWDALGRFGMLWMLWDGFGLTRCLALSDFFTCHANSGSSAVCAAETKPLHYILVVLYCIVLWYYRWRASPQQ